MVRVARRKIGREGSWKCNQIVAQRRRLDR